MPCLHKYPFVFNPIRAGFCICRSPLAPPSVARQRGLQDKRYDCDPDIKTDLSYVEVVPLMQVSVVSYKREQLLMAVTTCSPAACTPLQQKQQIVAFQFVAPSYFHPLFHQCAGCTPARTVTPCCCCCCALVSVTSLLVCSSSWPFNTWHGHKPILYFNGRHFAGNAEVMTSVPSDLYEGSFPFRCCSFA